MYFRPCLSKTQARPVAAPSVPDMATLEHSHIREVLQGDWSRGKQPHYPSSCLIHWIMACVTWGVRPEDHTGLFGFADEFPQGSLGQLNLAHGIDRLADKKKHMVFAVCGSQDGGQERLRVSATHGCFERIAQPSSQRKIPNYILAYFLSLHFFPSPMSPKDKRLLHSTPLASLTRPHLSTSLLPASHPYPDTSPWPLTLPWQFFITTEVSFSPSQKAHPWPCLTYQS